MRPAPQAIRDAKNANDRKNKDAAQRDGATHTKPGKAKSGHDISCPYMEQGRSSNVLNFVTKST